MKKFLLFTLLLSLAACTPRQGSGPTNPRSGAPADTAFFQPPNNIVLMIGDGMGLTQITAGMYMNGNRLNLEEFTHVGLQKPHPAGELITDSAAAATAIASGRKTYNGAIGVDERGKPVTTILERARVNGMHTGLVVTSTITHATPAGFYAHQPDRNMEEEIAADLVAADVDFFVGGGKKYFDERTDGRNLIDELWKKGYFVSDYSQSKFEEVKIEHSRKFAYFSANEKPSKASSGRDYLPLAAKAAVETLAAGAEHGFFLMVEGSQIDWAGHENNSGYIVNEMIDFDKAIGAVLDFAKEDGQTLVIVTADHETGGYAINPGSTWDTIRAGFTTEHHTATLVPVFAWGPGAKLFSGMYENTAIFGKISRALGLGKQRSGTSR
jgi:alkaline phosphatase